MVTNALFTTLREGGLHKTLCLKEFKGFTLAEVLITLVIIGVIAAMTIPTLINKTNNHEYISRLKKAYSTMAQATNRIIAEEGNPRADIGGWATSSEAIFNMYKKYLNNAKICGLDTGCFEGAYRRMDNKLEQYDSGRYTLVIADGTEISMRDAEFDNSCSKNTIGSYNTCQIILIDVNGAKGPNAVGRDTFAFTLKENGFFPAGCDAATACVNITHGWDCTCNALREGAINY